MTAETVNAAMTAAQIDAQISAAREYLAQLDIDARRLSLPAVSGDKAASEELAGVRQSIAKVTADLGVLNNARLDAVRKEAEADAAATAANQARHLEAAREHAAELVKLATRGDELIAAYRELITDLAEAERKTGDALRAAGERSNAAIVGRHDLGRFLVERVLSIHKGQDKFRLEQRPLATIAATAWADLLSEKGEADE